MPTMLGVNCSGCGETRADIEHLEPTPGNGEHLTLICHFKCVACGHTWKEVRGG